MGRSAILAVVFSAAILALPACGSSHYVQRGADLYGDGRFVEADEVFARSEPRVARAPLDERAAYAAYRGATFIALGDLPHAHHWLTMASEIERSHPGTLRPVERAFLDSAWRAYGNRLPPTPPPANTAVASSSQVPSPSVESVPPAPQRALAPTTVPQ